jgi:hypothetical protein
MMLMFGSLIWKFDTRIKDFLEAYGSFKAYRNLMNLESFSKIRKLWELLSLIKAFKALGTEIASSFSLLFYASLAKPFTTQTNH